MRRLNKGNKRESRKELQANTILICKEKGSSEKSRETFARERERERVPARRKLRGTLTCQHTGLGVSL